MSCHSSPALAEGPLDEVENLIEELKRAFFHPEEGRIVMSFGTILKQMRVSYFSI